MKVFATSRRYCFARPATLLALGLALASAPAGMAVGGEAAKSSPAPATSSSVVVSNLSRPDLDKLPVMRPEENIFRPKMDSMEPVFTPFRPSAPSAETIQRQRELMERRRNWLFNEPDGLKPKPGWDEKSKPNGLDGKAQPELDPMQKYYQDVAAKQGVSVNDLNQMLGAGRNRDFAGTNLNTRLNLGIGTNDLGAWSAPTPAGKLDGLPAWAGGPAEKVPTPAEKERVLQHRREVEDLLEHRNPAPEPFGLGRPAAVPSPTAIGPQGVGMDLLTTGPATPATSAAAAAAVATPRVEYRNAANPILGASIQQPSLRPHVLDDPTARALGLPQPDPAKLSEQEKPKSKPPEPQFVPPLRKF